MGWKEFLAKIKLADIQHSINVGKGSLVSVNVEKNEYNFTLPNVQTIKEFQHKELTRSFELMVKAEVERRLKHIDDILNSMASAIQQEIVTAAATSTAINFTKSECSSRSAGGALTAENPTHQA